jgi:hypothetical protein
MGFFSQLGFGIPADSIARVLDHPRELQCGDMIEFSLLNQSQFSHKTLEVTQIWTLNFGDKHHKRVYFNLNDLQQNIRLSVLEDDRIEIACEVFPDTLLQIFKEQHLADILDPDSGVHHQLKSKIKNLDELPEELQGWVSKKYRQEGFEQAYRYNDDYRHKTLPEAIDSGEMACDYAWLVSDDRNFSVEFRVFDGGRTEAHLCAIIPLRKIEALWPAKQD